MSINSWVKKLETSLLECDDRHVEKGLTWYKEANLYANYLANSYGLPVDCVAQIMAVISPATLWARNKADTATLLGYLINNTNQGEAVSLKLGTYKQNINKAIKVFNYWLIGRHLGEVNPFNETSQKTWAFYRNIMLDGEFITIDRHAFKAAAGKKLTKERVKHGGAVSISKVLYQRMANSYKQLANKYNLTPYELQAILWERQVSLTKRIGRTA